ncbi:MAG: pyruvate carboxylase subunit B [Brevinema sp.]
MSFIDITETILRDGNQSLLATRMPTEDMIPVIDLLDQVGYRSLEVWGGATFDVCMRFLNQSPWERLREIKKRAKKTPLQMLLRGQTLVGYRHYADDTVDLFLRHAIENGIDIVRIFDALNDLRNLETAVKFTKKYGAKAQVAISYTSSPVHTIDYYINLAKSFEQMGADEICIKDMAGILLPEDGYRLVKGIKDVMPKMPVIVHTHDTGGIGAMLYLRVADAGADSIDTSLSTLGGGSAQPVTESMVNVLAQTKRSTRLNEEILKEAAEYFKPLRKKYLDEGLLDIQAYFTEPEILRYQLPGGMLSNLVSQLKSQKALHRYEEVLKEIPRVREDFGFPPLVTPMSQIVGTQSVMNVLMGERYKMCPKESKDYVLGKYGKSPSPVSNEIRVKIAGDGEVYTGSPAALVLPEIEKAREEYTIASNDEELVSCILFPQVAIPYLQRVKAPSQVIEVEIIS